MNAGMLWFDNDPKTELPQKIEKAAAYYKKKYSASPTHCYVNPKMLEVKKLKAGNIQVKPNPTIQPHHFWLGVEVKA